MDLSLLKDSARITAQNGLGIGRLYRTKKERPTSKITLIGIDTAKQVFHLVGVDAHSHYVWRKQLCGVGCCQP